MNTPTLTAFTLKHFNAVLSRLDSQLHVDTERGIVYEAGALWAREAIQQYISSTTLTGAQLNQTFHKSWDKIRNSSRFELLVEQIRHYISTYGSSFKDEVYIPDEILNVPETKIKFRVIHALTADQLKDKCLGMLRSGVAMKSETIDELITVLDEVCHHVFSVNDGIRNNEAKVKLFDKLGIVPTDPVDVLRIAVFKSTGETLLIKNGKMIEAIKSSSYNPNDLFCRCDGLAEIFNRFKPIFLAFKPKCPQTINAISRLSKTRHKPLPANAVNLVTARAIEAKDEHWLTNATPFALMKAANALGSRMAGQTSFMYKIRNGKTWSKKGTDIIDNSIFIPNFDLLLAELASRYQGPKKVFIPSNLKYGLPTSEKMFIGNVPMGTRIYADQIAVGVYWENSWGARDIDLSGITQSGTKVGWNGWYNSDQLMYSGDITNAPDGAVEYLYTKSDYVHSPTIVYLNMFSGREDSKYRVIVGEGEKITSYDYMMNPNNLIFQLDAQAVQHQMIFGLLSHCPYAKKNVFTVTNLGAGQARVSMDKESPALDALIDELQTGLSFNDVLQFIGVTIVANPKEAELDLSIDKLSRDSFMKLFK